MAKMKIMQQYEEKYFDELYLPLLSTDAVEQDVRDIALLQVSAHVYVHVCVDACMCECMYVWMHACLTYCLTDIPTDQLTN